MTDPLPSSRPTRVRHAVMGLVLGLTAIAYMDRVCISVAKLDMAGELGLSERQMGWVFSAFTLSYALLEIPAGWLADRFGPRWMLARIVVWWSLFTALTGLAGGFVSLLLIRILFGAGEAGVFPGIARTFAHWMPAHQHGRCFGIAVACGALGGALTQPVAAGLLATLGWRWMFPVFGAVGVVWAVVWLVWFRDDPREHRSVNAAEVAWIGQPAASGHASVPWGALARSRNLWAVCVMYFGIIYGWYFYLTWLPTYLKQARGFDLKAVGWASALPLAGIAAGVFAGGWLSDLLVAHVGRRRARALPGVAGLPLAALAVELASHADTGMQATGWLTAAAGLAALGCAPGWAVCVEIGRSRAGVVSGAMNMCGNLGGALSPLVTGWCLGAGWGWNGPLHTLALGYLLAAVAWCCIDPDKVLE